MVNVGNTVDDAIVLSRNDIDLVVWIFFETSVDVCNTVNAEVVLVRTETDVDVWVSLEALVYIYIFKSNIT